MSGFPELVEAAVGVYALYLVSHQQQEADLGVIAGFRFLHWLVRHMIGQPFLRRLPASISAALFVFPYTEVYAMIASRTPFLIARLSLYVAAIRN